MNQRLIFLLFPFSILISVAYCYGAEIFNQAGSDQAASKGVIRVPKQVGSSPGGTVQNGKDHQQAGGHHFEHHGHGHGFGGGLGGGAGGGGGLGMGHGHHGDGKYFIHLDMYIRKTSPSQYELAYIEESPWKTEQRVERVDGITKQGKVKWGDKYGGYGEHFWDYNHADKSHGHEGGGGGGSGGGGGGGYGHGHDDGGHGHGHGHYSEQVPTYASPNGDGPNKVTNKRQSKNQEEADRSQVKGEQEPLIRPFRLRERSRPPPPAISQSQNQPTLTLNPVSGRVTDESTGKTYVLKPAN